MLGITPRRGEEIAEDVTNLMRSSTNRSSALLNIVKKYDAESVLAGIRFEFLLNMSERNKSIVKLTAKRQNAPLN